MVKTQAYTSTNFNASLFCSVLICSIGDLWHEDSHVDYQHNIQYYAIINYLVMLKKHDKYLHDNVLMSKVYASWLLLWVTFIFVTLDQKTGHKGQFLHHLKAE